LLGLPESVLVVATVGRCRRARSGIVHFHATKQENPDAHVSDDTVPGVSSFRAEGVRRRGLKAVMPDGITLVADAWHPASGGPWPVLLQRLPYGRSVASTPVLPTPAQLARRGYAVVVQDVRGRGDSEGVFTPFVDEGPDGAATVEWASQLPFSNGEVVTYGYSYQGLSQLYTAARRPPGLRAIAPMMCSSEPYESWIYDGGCLRWEFVATWAAQLANQDLDNAVVTPDYAAIPLVGALGPSPPAWFAEWLSHPDDDSYWAARRPDLSAIDVPVFTVLGYFDDFAAGTARLIGSLGASAVCGPWVHMPWGTRLGDVEIEGASPRIAIDGLYAFLDGVLGGRAFARDVRYFSMGGGWRKGPSWPPPHRMERWSAVSDGFANSRHGDGLLTAGPGGRAGGLGHPDVLVAEPLVPYPADGQPLRAVAASEDRRDVLCYTSPVLESPMDLAGSPVVRVSAIADVHTFDVMAALVVVDGRGEGREISVGSRRVVPPLVDSPVDVVVELRPMAMVVEPGARLRLDLSASRFPALDRNPQSPGSAAGMSRSQYRVATIEVLSASIDLPVGR
jgi:putative CocE/NonD family hydrolase